MAIDHHLDPDDIRTRLLRGPLTEKLSFDAACQINMLIDAVASCRVECDRAVEELSAECVSTEKLAEVVNRLRSTANYAREVAGEEKPV
jgi:hypothetical protein